MVRPSSPQEPLAGLVASWLLLPRGPARRCRSAGAALTHVCRSTGVTVSVVRNGVYRSAGARCGACACAMSRESHVCESVNPCPLLSTVRCE